ncbi:hypothetical protein OHV05_35035 [Kitasatospora sp. NBC_00070]
MVEVMLMIFPWFDVAPPNRQPNPQKYAVRTFAGEIAWFTPARPGGIEI